MAKPKRKPIASPFTRNFTQVLRERNLTVKQASGLLGVPYSTAMGFTTGAIPNDLAAISRFCTALSIDFEWLLTGKVKNVDASQIPLDQLFDEEKANSFSGIYRLTATKLVPKSEKKKGGIS